MPAFSFSDDTQANWSTGARVPAVDELCWSNDTRRFVVGDGASGWSGIRGGIFAPTPTPEFVNCNPDSLRMMRAVLARARVANTTAAGGSLTGLYALGCSIINGHATGSAQNSPLLLAARSLWSRGIPAGGTGWVPAWNNEGGNSDNRWTHGFGGTPTGASTPSGDVLYRTSTAAGQTETFVSDVPGVNVGIAVLAGGGAFTVTIDGTAATAATTTTSGGLTVTTYTAANLSQHSVVVTASTATAVSLVAARVSSQAGLELHQWGLSSSTSGSALTSAPAGSPGASWPVLFPAPGVVVIDGGYVYNDGLAQNTSSATVVAATTTTLSTLLTQLTAAGHAPVLLLPHAPPTSAAQAPTGGVYVTAAVWESFRQNCHALAGQYNIPLLDMTFRWKDYATASSLGLAASASTDNGVHPSAVGDEDYAAALLALLTTGFDAYATHADPTNLLAAPINSWTNWNGGWQQASYQKTSAGTVNLAGLVAAPVVTLPSVSLTLPVGYRPGMTHTFAVYTSAGIGRVDVTASGAVNMISGPTGAGAYWTLDGISFQADQ